MASFYPLVFWVSYAVILLFDRERVASQLCIGGLLATTVVGALVVLWRVQLVRTVFADGVEAAAAVSGVGFARGAGRILYTYTYLGQTHQGGNYVNSITRTRALKIGDSVTLLIDRNNPKLAFIRELYL